jgi:predicted MFS family arabinose efflux permease
MNLTAGARSPALESAVNKARRRLVPFLLLMYVVAFLDRVNVGFAKQSLQDAVGLSDAAFALGASIFFVSYVLLEVPSNLALHKVGAKLWMARIMITWGLVSAATMFVQGPMSFYSVRLALGAFEAGFFPGVILYLTYWFPDRDRAGVMGLFYFGAPLSFMFGGPLSGLLLSNLNGTFGLLGYQWMFLIEGLLATLVGIWAYFYLTDRPGTAKWLTSDEKHALGQAIAREQLDKVSHGPSDFLSAMADVGTLYFALIFFLIQIGVAVILFFLPSQISKLTGAGIGTVGLVIAVPWTCALVATFVVPRLAAKFDQLRLFGALSLAASALGLAVSANSPPMVAVVAICIAVAGIWAAQPIFWTLLTGYLGGAAAVTGIAFVNTLANIGGFVSPNIKAWADASFGSPIAGLFMAAGVTLLVALMFFGLGRVGLRKTAILQPAT